MNLMRLLARIWFILMPIYFGTLGFMAEWMKSEGNIPERLLWSSLAAVLLGALAGIPLVSFWKDTNWRKRSGPS